MVKGHDRPYFDHLTMEMIGLLVLIDLQYMCGCLTGVEDNQKIPNNIPSQREEDLQRENINALTTKFVVHVSQKFILRKITRV
jgi:hypothetical protein